MRCDYDNMVVVTHSQEMLITVNSCDRVFWKPRCFLIAWPSLLLWLLQDRSWFETQLEGHLSSHFSLSRDEVLGSDGGRLVYGDFMVPGADPKNYEQVCGGLCVPVSQLFCFAGLQFCCFWRVYEKGGSV